MDKPADHSELNHRLPEIQRIRRTDLRKETERIFIEDCPAYFWIRPASSSGNYHPDDHAKRHGLWIHTKRAFTAYERLARSYQEQDKITQKELEYGKAAILLHDIFKYGKPPEHSEHTVDDHDKIAARYLERNADLPEKVISCIDSHNGPWYAGKQPESDLEQVHHMADMIASDTNGFFRIEKPHKKLYKVLERPEHER